VLAFVVMANCQLPLKTLPCRLGERSVTQRFLVRNMLGYASLTQPAQSRYGMYINGKRSKVRMVRNRFISGNNHLSSHAISVNYAA
jgi:hypothetical protein